MRQTCILTLLLLISISIFSKSNQFEFVLKGKVIGIKSGELSINKSNIPEDRISIPIIDGKFEYQGTASNIVSTMLLISGSKQYYPMVIEPGEIILELNAASLFKKSKTLKGSNSIALREAKDRYYKIASKHDVSSMKQFIRDNSKNFGGIYYLNMFYRHPSFFNEKELGAFISGIEDSMLCQSKDFIELKSFWMSRKDSINALNHVAFNFSLPDKTGKSIEFNGVAKGKLVFVEKSGSWCGNLTSISESYKPIYEKYKDKGFEIITIVCESKYDRWKKWIEMHNFGWISLVELDSQISNEVLYRELLFDKKDPYTDEPQNYLVDEKGIVIAKNLTTESLNELLIKKYEPEQLQKNLNEKWEMPKSTYILDKEQPINSFKELTKLFSGKSFFIDCWATWCSPCINEFNYKKELEDYLKSKDIELVYVNFDNHSNQWKWLNYIKKYNLTGSHLQANETFQKDFRKFGYKNTLPAYMIVNENGQVVEQNAYRPSDKEKLFNQIAIKLKK